MTTLFYQCPICGNVAFMALSSGVTPVCCGKPMLKLDPKTADQGHEKHVPVVRWKAPHKLAVTVGSMPHPMELDHHISFVCLETSAGVIIQNLSPTQTPEVCFRFLGWPLNVYSFCNIHGLWQSPVPPVDEYCNDTPQCEMHC